MPVKMIWNPLVPTKVGSFVWKVSWGKIWIMDQLKKRGFSLASKCPFCGQHIRNLPFFWILLEILASISVNLVKPTKWELLGGFEPYPKVRHTAPHPSGYVSL